MDENTNSLPYENVCSSARIFSDAFYKVVTSDTEENIVTSPLSLHIILSLLSYGARDLTSSVLKTGLFHSDTDMDSGFKKLMTVLNDAKDVELKMANTIYIQEELQLVPYFLSSSGDIFKADVSLINFKEASKAIKQINLWVIEKTRNKIQEVISLDDISDETRALMINAVYFKSFWLRKFDPKLTTKEDFRNVNNKVKQVSMMSQISNFAHGILNDSDARILEIPYKNDDFDMVIVLPKELDGLNSLEQNLDWNTVLNTPLHRSKVELFLPKFKLNVKLNLKSTLEKLGMRNIFQDDSNFSGISSTPLKVSQVVQKIFIEVDEEGSEAAAATGVQMRLRRCVSEEKVVFKVDRPFLFTIRYKPNNVPLFIGSVRDIGMPIVKDEL